MAVLISTCTIRGLETIVAKFSSDIPGSSGRAVGGRRLVTKSAISGAPSRKRTTTAMTIVNSGLWLPNLAGAGTRSYLTNQIDYITESQNANAQDGFSGADGRTRPRTRHSSTRESRIATRLIEISYCSSRARTIYGGLGDDPYSRFGSLCARHHAADIILSMRTAAALLCWLLNRAGNANRRIAIATAHQ